jgi:small subunit ribosomal protein S9
MPTKETKTRAAPRAAKVVAPEKVVAEKPVKKVAARYIEAVGRRKTSTARVRITEASKESIVINDKEVAVYFPTAELQSIINAAIPKSKVVGKFSVSAHIVGGGIHSQAEAFRHGLSRALVTFDLETRKRLKKLGFLKRDPRMKERRKFGLKKARKAPQWSKR